MLMCFISPFKNTYLGPGMNHMTTSGILYSLDYIEMLHNFMKIFYRFLGYTFLIYEEERILLGFYRNHLLQKFLGQGVKTSN